MRGVTTNADEANQYGNTCDIFSEAIVYFI